MKKSWIIWSLLGLMTLFVAACKDDDEGPTEIEIAQARLEQQIVEIESFLAAQNISAEKDSRGIFHQPLTLNPEGELIEEGDVALVNYKISRLDGTLIGQSEPGNPELITYSPNRRYFPIAIRYGLEDVRVGETHRYYVPSGFGYTSINKSYTDGERYLEFSNLILEMEIVGVYHSLQEIYDAEQADIQAWLQAEGRTAEELAGGLHKIVLTEGTGEAPVNGDSVFVYYKGYFLDGQVFDENTSGAGFDVKLGTTSLVTGFTQALRTMVVGEKSLFILPSSLAYGTGQTTGGAFVLPRQDLASFKEKGFLKDASAVPPFSTLIFEIEMLSKK
ncbi:FKBP-type peptidyl-prolyl cis-trans isomerase [Cesiribacter sp. SM1]|uniref:FKBP-type peptidyl-prolyl cis-trans isomerase n=1 Tax=Cesiribacter sp. SM1 TaxID=2861196 RepID=UPI001CD81795|nr:FKBP-type peptidyl-prolyl cis-trans isomerase [Cesiribacter sp. SM1]